MIVNDKNEVKACRLQSRDIGLEALFFAALSIHRCPLLFFYVKNRTERNRKMNKQLWNKFECSCLEIFLGGKVDWYWTLNSCGTVHEWLWNRKYLYLRHLWLQGHFITLYVCGLVFRYLWYHGHLVFRHLWHHFIDHRSSLCDSISLSRTERNGTEWNGTDWNWKIKLLNFVGT